jgi:hypothetical protein
LSSPEGTAGPSRAVDSAGSVGRIHAGDNAIDLDAVVHELGGLGWDYA